MVNILSLRTITREVQIKPSYLKAFGFGLLAFRFYTIFATNFL